MEKKKSLYVSIGRGLSSHPPIQRVDPRPLPQDNQWQRKKQTKEQARAAKRGKLDPDSALNRNAKEVLDERARNKRKAKELEESDEDDEDDADSDDDEVSVDLEGIDKELPGQGLKKRKATDDEPAKKKAKLAEPLPETDEPAETLSAHQQKKLSKLQKKLDKRAEKKANKPEKAAKTSKVPVEEDPAEGSDDEVEDPVVPSKEVDDGSEEKSRKSKNMVPIDISGLADDEEANRTSQSSTPGSPTFDSPAGNPTTELASTTTSIASDSAATSERPSSSSKKLKVPSDTTELRARLAAKIASLRAARKADGPDGLPIRTRQELIESRRLKQIKSKAHKKELWQKQKAEEDAKREEALASARDSPMLSFGSPGSPEQENNFSFGRVAFTDGTQMSQDLSYLKEKRGKKQNLDPKSALAKLEAQKKRLANLDDDKRKDVLEKETWLAARKRAEGEKVRNDESLLKKAVKRKEKTKKKSEKEWGDRMDGVKYAQKQKAQKREANIKQRKEQKQAGKGGKKGKGSKGPTKKKTGGRPGFEGGGFGGGKKK